MRGTIAVAIALFIGFVIGRTSNIPATASPVDEVATRGVTLSAPQRAYCERYCTASVPGDRPRHITVEIGRGGGTAVPEGFE